MPSALTINSLKLLRRYFLVLKPDTSLFGRNWKMFSNKQYSNSIIYDRLISEKPCMIARFGANELNCLVNYLGVKGKDQYKSYTGYISSQTPEWWWNKSLLANMHNNAGFFPGTIEKVEQFCELMLNDIKELDILGSWLKQEIFFQKELENVKKVVLEDLEPFFSENPWTRALEGKKVLVVHPFAETIEAQYKNRELLFDNNLLPYFDLKTIKAVQSIAGQKTQFSDWFQALDFMKGEIDKLDYDICIIGAGAYGFPLAAHVKRKGKKAIHLAGITQFLFGIKGKRWENYIVWPYTNLYNEYWVRPSQNEKPRNAQSVENACYW